MVCVMPKGHELASRPVVSPRDLAPYPFIALERGTRLGEAVRKSFELAETPFRHTVEVRYCNTACVLAAARVGVSVVDPFSPRLDGSHDLEIKPFVPQTPAVAYVLWSEAQPLSRLARAFLQEIRTTTEDRSIATPKA
jgi:DNA-binding transcriptional LysR family regulator